MCKIKDEIENQRVEQEKEFFNFDVNKNVICKCGRKIMREKNKVTGICAVCSGEPSKEGRNVLVYYPHDINRDVEMYY